MRQAAHHRRAAPGRRTGRPAGRLPAARGAGLHQPGPATADRRRDLGHRPEEQEGRRARWTGSSPRSAPSSASSPRPVTTTCGRAGGSLLAEAVARLRRGEVRREAGYDGEYGVITLFGPGELNRSEALFDLAVPGPRSGRPAGSRGPSADAAGWPGGSGDQPAGQGGPPAGPDGQPARPARTRSGRRARPAAPGSAPGDLDPDQRAAAEAESPLMIVAGPGTGKTRTLTHRIADQPGAPGPRPPWPSRSPGGRPRRCARGWPRCSRAGPAGTCRGSRSPPSTGWACRSCGSITSEPGWRPASGWPTTRRGSRSPPSSPDRRGTARGCSPKRPSDPAARERLVKALAARDLVDFDGLIELPAALLAAEPAVTGSLRGRWPQISVDEYQDIDAAQYRLLRLLAGDGRGLTVIGDPDQAIYGFRGADVDLFLRFGQRLPRRHHAAADPELPVQRGRSSRARCRPSRRPRSSPAGCCARPRRPGPAKRHGPAGGGPARRSGTADGATRPGRQERRGATQRRARWPLPPAP